MDAVEPQQHLILITNYQVLTAKNLGLKSQSLRKWMFKSTAKTPIKHVGKAYPTRARKGNNKNRALFIVFCSFKCIDLSAQGKLIDVLIDQSKNLKEKTTENSKRPLPMATFGGYPVT